MDISDSCFCTSAEALNAIPLTVHSSSLCRTETAQTWIRSVQIPGNETVLSIGIRVKIRRCSDPAAADCGVCSRDLRKTSLLSSDRVRR